MSDLQPLPFPTQPEPPMRRGEAMRDATSRGHARVAHIRRCRAAGPPSESDIARIVAEYLAKGGPIHICKPAYVLPVQNGSGRADTRS